MDFVDYTTCGARRTHVERTAHIDSFSTMRNWENDNCQRGLVCRLALGNNVIEVFC